MNDLPENVESLGLMAAHCEFWAQQPELSYADRADLMRRAQYYRDLQLAELNSLHPCRTEGCPTMVAGSDYCPRCEEEISGEPYPLANILLEPGRAFAITAYAFLGIGLGLIAFLLALIF